MKLAKLVILLPVLASSACIRQVKYGPEIVPSPGNSCTVLIDPIGEIPQLVQMKLTWNWGGDAGVGRSDSRTLKFRPQEKYLTLWTDGAAGPVSTTLGQDVNYILRVWDFTDSATATTRDATLYWPGGSKSLTLKLDMGTNWPLEDYTVTTTKSQEVRSPVTPDAITCYVLDVTEVSPTSNAGFCVYFDFSGLNTSGNGAGLDILLALDPQDNVPNTPRVDLNYSYIDLDAAAGTATVLPAAVLRPTTIGLTNFATGAAGAIDVDGLLSSSTQLDLSVAKLTPPPIFDQLVPVPTTLLGNFPVPGLSVYPEGSLTGSTNESFLRFALDGGKNVSVELAQ